MKKLTVTAFNGTGKDKVLAGSKEIDAPESIEEAVDAFGSDVVLEKFMRSHVIDVQRDIRSGSNTSDKAKLNQLLAKARDAKKNGDTALADMLAEHGITL